MKLVLNSLSGPSQNPILKHVGRTLSSTRSGEKYQFGIWYLSANERRQKIALGCLWVLWVISLRIWPILAFWSRSPAPDVRPGKVETLDSSRKSKFSESINLRNELYAKNHAGWHQNWMHVFLSIRDFKSARRKDAFAPFGPRNRAQHPRIEANRPFSGVAGPFPETPPHCENIRKLGVPGVFKTL